MQTTGTLVDSAARAERSSRWIWGGMIVGLLSVQIFCCLFALFLATTSTSMAIIPDYHRKALSWDATREEIRSSDRLGWKTIIEVSGPVDIYGNRTVTIWLSDSAARPVSVDDFSLTAYRHADAANVIEIPLVEIAAGTYQAQAELIKAGLWQFELQAERGADLYVDSMPWEVMSR